jgi:hypothetical protein
MLNRVRDLGQRFLVIGALAAGSAGALGAVTTFDNGLEGWSVSGRTTISQTGGNPGANLDVELLDVFGAEIRNTTNAAFLGDYTARGPIRLTVDVKTNSIDFFGTPVTRDLVVELRDHNPPGSSYPWVSVWRRIGTLDAGVPGWVTYSADILDPTAEELPEGWGGTGDEDPVTYEPRLPPGRTFASVLASVDELHFTTFVPGFFYGFTNFDIQVDNVGFEPLPPAYALGDANCDDSVDFFDIDPFLVALFDTPAYQAGYCGGSLASVDTDCSGQMSFFDIDPFLACLFGGCTPCP